jgi:hypothetical protein
MYTFVSRYQALHCRGYAFLLVLLLGCLYRCWVVYRGFVAGLFIGALLLGCL